MRPLTGTTVIEMVGLGPAPYATLLLEDLGARVIRIDRIGDRLPSAMDPVNRGRPAVRLDLKNPDTADVVLRLVEKADAIIDPFRPGVMERLGLGPDVCLQRNERLVYLRMTGWGQDGSLASTAGHDINYLALSGALHLFQRDSHRPMPPLNLLGDYAGGSLFLVTGLMGGLLQAGRSGKGDVVDVSIVDGVASLLTVVAAWRGAGAWDDHSNGNMLQTAAPFYDVYPTSDGRHVAVGAIEAQFYAQFVAGLGLDAAELPRQYDRAAWPAVKKLFAQVIAGEPLAHWERVFAGTDACVTPVLTMEEAAAHEHLAHRAVYGAAPDYWPAAAPRFRSGPEALAPAARVGDYADVVLADAGMAPDEISGLRRRHVLG